MNNPITQAAGNQIAKEFEKITQGEDGKGKPPGAVTSLPFQTWYEAPIYNQLEIMMHHTFSTNQMDEHSVWLSHTFFLPKDVRTCIELKEKSHRRKRTGKW